MDCFTFSKSQEWKNKKIYNTLDEAILQAKKQNAHESTIQKLEAYKCTHCHKYHVGRNGKLVTQKEKEKYKKELGIDVKILGKINLEMLKTDSNNRYNTKIVGWIDLSKIKH